MSAPLVSASSEEEVYLLPVSSAQRRLWFVNRLEPGSPLYNIPLAWRLRGPLQRKALAAALSELTARHEVLRTTFEVEDDEPMQVIAPPRALPLPEVDLADLPASSREVETRRLLAAEAARPFDLERGPLFSAALLLLGADDHVLLAGVHHIVADGGSLPVLRRDLSALYGAALAGAPSLLPGLPIQYADFAVWQREWLAGEVMEQQLDYWRRQLGDAPPVQELPLAGPRPAARSHRGVARTLALSERAAAGLDVLARRQGATRFMVLLAAFQTLLFRLTPESGRSDVVVGTPIDNRGQEETEGLIGLFVNTLALRTELAGRPSFYELVARVRHGALEAYANQDLPFELLVEELRPERDLSHDPLVQVVFSVQERSAEGLRLAGLEVEPLEIHHGLAKLALALLVETAGRSWRVRADAAADLFSAVTLDRLLASFAALADGAAANPGCPVTELPVLAEEARHQILREWNDTRTPQDQEGMDAIHRWVAAWTKRTPSAPALIAEREEISYGELDRRANQLAHHLLSQGVGRGARVAVALPHSPERVVALLGVLKAGGAYVSLDPHDPPERRDWVLADCGARVLLAEGGFPALGHQPSHDPGVEAGGEDLAYVIYTSGSTGRPKGVEIPHRGLLNLVQWHRQAYAVTLEDRAAQMAGEGFDASVWELWPYLAFGAAVCFPPGAARANPSVLIPWLARAGVTLCFLPTPIAELALDEAWPAGMRLRALLTGGDRLRRRPGPQHGFQLINHYGPTESSVVATSSLVAAGEAGDLPPIGRPVDGVRIYLLDPGGREVPLGVPGELCIGGSSLARGYLGRPGLTAERFLPDPWSAPGARLYRSGDLARHRPDGEIEFLGRIDQQVKIRGVRIELGEVEAALSAYPGLREAAVVVRVDGSGRSLLAACAVSAADSGGIVPEALRLWLRERLPEAMVPAVFLPFDTLPLTANGKVDRQALQRAPLPERVEDEEGSATPRSATEELLAGIWAEILRRDRVGLHDDFFTLGGHSLLATQVVSRALEVFRTELPLRQLFETPTVAGLAAHLDAARRGPLPPAITPVPRNGELRASFAQERLWFLDQFGDERASYNVPAVLSIKGPLAVAALEAALEELVCRHEVLRTTFASQPNGDQDVVQIVAPPLPRPLPVVDLEEAVAEAHRLAREEAARPFDLTRGPLLRTRLLRLGREEHLLLLTLHHVVSDGWSIGVLLRELSVLYDSFAAGRPSPLTELPVQYADFAVWQRGWLTGEVLEAQLGYWRRQLAGAPAVLELPADRPRPGVRSVDGGQRSAALPFELSEALGPFARQRGATPFMVLLAAFQALLGRLTGQEDLTTGSPVANRNRGETEGLIGFFVNTLVLRGNLSGDPGFGELLARVRETALGAYAHQDLPFEKLVAEIQPERDLSRSPLFQVMLMVQNLPRAAREGWRLVAPPEGGGTAKFDLTLSFGEAAEGGWAAQAEYRRDLFDAPTIDRLLAHFTALLTAAIQDPERRVTELPPLSAAERQQLLVEWNDTAAVPTAQDVCLHELITAQLARDPEAVAVTFEGDSLTCRELDRRAGCLASTLRRLGVGPERRVGVAMERSLEMVVALLGVLRAGAAYLPLDPSYPPERLAFMLEDGLGGEGEPPVLLTQEQLLDTLPSLPARILCLDAGWDGSGEDGSLRGVEVLPDHPAYVIYTSGSTGRPKGVVNTHRAIVNRLLWMQQAYGLTAGDCVLQKTPFSFDVSVWELFWPLLAGARLVLARPGGHQDPDYLVDLIERERVTTLHFVPSMLQVFLEHPLKHPEIERCAFLRTVVCSGEALPFDLQERFWSRFPRGVGLHNLYGPTEAAVDVTSWACERESALRGVPIGRPIANLRIHLLDAGLHPVPAGVPGELHIGGLGLARGYLRRPGLTAEKLIPDPFSATAGARLYKTGDLARHRTDGCIEYLGRIDHQVKIRGFRIELGEIEAALAAHPGMREVVVMMREDRPGDRRLVAYLVLEEIAGPEVQEILRAGLQERLPEYMIPSAFVVLPALPLSPNGKVDRRALGQHVLPEEGERSGFVPPETEEEQRMAAIWTEILGVPRVGLRDDFFRLGGHSLLATRVIARLRRDFQVDLPLRSLFQTPTIAGLLELVRQSGQSRPPAPAPRISTLSRSASQLRSRAALGSREEP